MNSTTLLWQLCQQNQFQQALQQGANEYEQNPTLELGIFLSSLLDEFGRNKASEQILSPLISQVGDFKLLLPHLFECQKQFYLLRKSPQTLKRLQIYTYFDPSNLKMMQECLEFSSSIKNAPNCQITFYTGTPFLKSFCPDDLTKQGLGGSETAFVMMAKLLAAQGFQVSCFCNTKESKTYEGVNYYPVEEFFLYESSHSIETLIVSRFLHPLEQKLKAKKKILWLHESLGCAAQENISAADSNIDYYFGLSDYQIDRVCERYQISKNKFYKTKNGFIEEDFVAGHPEPIERPNIDKTPYSLIYFSRPERGLKEALQVFEGLKKDFPDATLKVCTYTQKEKLEDDPQLAPLLPLLKIPGVEFLGSLSKKQLAQTLQNTQIFLYPNVTDSETSCIAAMEAMAAGCVVVTSDRGALPETLGNAGVIVKYNEDENKFIKNLFHDTKILLINSEQLEELSKLSLKRAWTIYPWKKVAEEWREFLNLKRL